MIFDVFSHAGRPKKAELPLRVEYGLTSTLMDNDALLAERHTQAGVFILATNDIQSDMTMAELLASYKQQQRVERAFVF